MGKKSRAKKASTPVERPAGESDGLIEFIRQLIRDRQFDEAMRAAVTLVESDPLNPLAHAILGSMLAQMDRPQDAVRHYEMAIRLGMKNDAEVYRSLAVTASLSRLPINALNAARLGSKLQTTPEQRELFDSVIAGSETYLRQLIGQRDIAMQVAERTMLLIEGCTRALQANEPDRARQRALSATQEAPNWPITWNNLAMLLFGLNEIPEAIAASEQGLSAVGEDDPTILTTLVRLYQVTGQHEAAKAALKRLTAMPNPDVAASEEIAKGYAILEDDEQVYDVLSGFTGEDNTLHPVGRYLLGVAAANIGKRDEARAAWRNLAREGLTQVRSFTEMLARNEEPPTPGARFPYFAAAEVVPGAVLEEVLTAAQTDPDSAGVEEAAERFPFLPFALTENFYAPIIDPRLAIELLLRLANPELTAAIGRFASSRSLGDYDRLYAHLALRGADLEDATATSSVWLNGRRRDLTLPKLHLHPPSAPKYGEEIAALMARGAEAQQQDDAAGAADAYRQVLEADPSIQEAQHNLGTALLLTGIMEEGEAHLRTSLEMDPEYILARCNLASLELSRGNLAGAHSFLDPVDSKVEFTLEEAIAYLRTRSDLAKADGDVATAEVLLHCVLAYDHDNNLAKERLTQLVNQPVGRAG